ncbi:hypothetical protein [Corallococcus exiguus]|uniref:hypothetical protein n=1 Tax=Corallococcus exiguus TaxID=83462 RepID=UPI00149428B7|nr:hypothetical protein [Corallococcus exiguus]NPD21932.1 hypothetical protein [Corallococcus exiguus]
MRELEHFLILADLSTLSEERVNDATSLIGRARAVLEGRQAPRRVVAPPPQHAQVGFELKSPPSFEDLDFSILGMEQERKSLLDVPRDSQDALASALTDILRSNTKARLFTDKDLVGFYQVAQQLMPEQEQEGFVYVALGRSPAVLAEFMRQAFHMEVLDLPLGGLSEGVKAELTLSVEAFLRRYLPVQKIRNKTVILIDYAHSGKSLLQVRGLVEQYAAKHLAEGECKVMIAPISSKPSMLKHAHSVMSKFDWETRAAHRLLKVLFTEIDKDVYSPNKSIKYTDIHHAREEDLPDVSQIAIPKNRQALEKAMQAALKATPRDFRVSEYLLPRSKKKKNFNYVMFGYGYNGLTLHEEEFFNKLRSKSARYHDLDLILDKYIDTEGHKRIAEYEKEEQHELYMKGVYRMRRFMAVVVLILFIYAVYWICSTVWRRFGR